MKLVVLIGLPGVGKSSWAESRYAPEQILSTDKYREQITGDVNDQSHNNVVFGRLYRDMENMLEAKRTSTIIFDATNLNVKARKRVIDLAHKHDAEVHADVFVAPLDVILQRNRQRGRVVPEEVIRKNYRTFHAPLATEEFDGVDYSLTATGAQTPFQLEMFMGDPLEAMRTLDAHSRLNEMRGFNQQNPHHTYDLWEHTTAVVTYLHKHKADWRIELAGLYHDIGKLDTQTFDRDGVAHYFGHQNVSTQLAIQELHGMVGNSDLCYITTLIHYHMDTYQWKTATDTDKFVRRLGSKTLVNDLMVLHEADLLAH